MLADGEGDAYVTSAVVTVILVHRHGGSSSRLQGPVTVPPKGSGPKEYCGRYPATRRVAPLLRPGSVRRAVPSKVSTRLQIPPMPLGDPFKTLLAPSPEPPRAPSCQQPGYSPRSAPVKIARRERDSDSLSADRRNASSDTGGIRPDRADATRRGGAAERFVSLRWGGHRWRAPGPAEGRRLENLLSSILNGRNAWLEGAPIPQQRQREEKIGPCRKSQLKPPGELYGGLMFDGAPDRSSVALKTC